MRLAPAAFAIVISMLLLPFASAAGADDSPSIWHRGFVSAATLDGLKLSDRFDPIDGGDRPDRFAGIETGLFLDRDTFEAGEPVNAWFVVRNTTDAPTGLDMRLDFLPGANLLVNSCTVTITDSAGRTFPAAKSHVWACGGPPHVVLDPRGYYCVKGDLAAAGPLPPGDYVAHWHYHGSRRSNDVRFRIVPAKSTATTRVATPEATGRVAVLFLSESAEVPPHATEPPPPPPTADARAPVRRTFDRAWRVDAGPVAAAVASGIDGRHYPSLLGLPTRDDLCTLAATFHRAPGGELSPPERVQLTLEPVGVEKVWAQWDHVALLVQSLEPPTGGAAQHIEQEQAWQERARRPRLQPLSHDPSKVLMSLPPDWARSLPFGGRVRLCVMVGSQPLRKTPTLRVAPAERWTGIRWGGVLRTEFIEVALPPKP